jgi:SAM-dependent methyltransferase
MDPKYTAEYEAFEHRHWWFVVRRQIILDAIEKFARPGQQPVRWLDIGCGSGVLLQAVTTITDKIGVELDPLNVERGRSKGLDIRPVERAWNFSDLGMFDLVTACDVVEHVEHESPALDAIYSAVKPRGLALITVPALMSLWGRHDVINHHYRRYTKRTLLPLFAPDRWDVLSATYFSSLLLPLIWTVRKFNQLRGDAGHDMKFGPKPVDRTLQTIFGMERPLLKMMSLPIGSSLLLVCRKREG